MNDPRMVMSPAPNCRACLGRVDGVGWFFGQKERDYAN